MSADKRKHHRRLVEQVAWIMFSDGSHRPCTIRDLSLEGARLCISQSGFVPDRFVMAMTADRKTTRTCQVMWRRGAYIGVWFAPADRAGLANAKAPLVHRQRHSFMFSRA